MDWMPLFSFSAAKKHFLPKKLFIHAVISIYINITCGEKDEKATSRRGYQGYAGCWI
jgi:hypothetical protein